jgi:predicted Zn-dependent protease with MMP-like domain
MDYDSFERLVLEALADLPEAFRSKLDNVEVVIEDWADSDTLRIAGVSHPTQLLGFYHGVPQTRRTRAYGGVLPDKISLFQRAIEAHARAPAALRTQVYRVLYHEIAHHFGISDARIEQLQASKRRTADGYHDHTSSVARDEDRLQPEDVDKQ